MPSWFSKVFKSEPAKPKPVIQAPVRDIRSGGIDLADDKPPPGRHTPRKVVYAPVLKDAGGQSGRSPEVRIKARVEKGNRACAFLLDRPVLEGYSAWFPYAEAATESPLAQALFAIPSVDTVLIHGYTLTVARKPTVFGDWDQLAKEIGSAIRAHLLEEKPVITHAYLDAIPPEETIRQTLQRVIDTEINPGIAAHSGAIRLDRVEGNTVYIEMMGGCQGCAASDLTLRQGVHEAFRSALPGLGAILDVTDHAAGTNPFYNQLPAGMR
ncbi:MAG: NifU family protein [Candidatus Hydrogenedentes bacterium]|nr:NifU family protein [Candidatus Hydrogenedentota bacterium]